MSIVLQHLIDARVLDLFAGSGALGLEALSRGAASADLVEVSATGVRAIRENAELLGAGPELRVHRADAMRFIEKLEPAAFDVAFADPPYGQGFAEALADAFSRTPFAALLCIEHGRGDRLPELPGARTRRYGDTHLTFIPAPE